MYVCNCHKVTDQHIAQAMDRGASSINDLQQQLKVGTNCGSCIEHAMIVMKAYKSDWSNLNYALATQVA